jgi:hypothetical protein
MKKILVILLSICSLSSAFGQVSVSTIGRAVTQCNNFKDVKNLLLSYGLICDEEKSNENFVAFYKPSQYAYSTMIVDVYKMKYENKVEKCVVKFYNLKYISDLKMLGYKYCSPDTVSLAPFQELYQSGVHEMGLNRDKQGWLIATFFRYDQDVELEHLENLDK